MTLSADDEGLAAEYALGTLDAGERATVAARRLRESELDAAIAAWEARLAPLLEATPERAPPADLLARIEAALGRAPAAVDLTEVLRGRLARWRALAGGATAVGGGLGGGAGVRRRHAGRSRRISSSPCCRRARTRRPSR